MTVFQYAYNVDEDEVFLLLFLVESFQFFKVTYVTYQYTKYYIYNYTYLFGDLEVEFRIIILKMFERNRDRHSFGSTCNSVISFCDDDP
jgi:hypothetical protein